MKIIPMLRFFIVSLAASLFIGCSYLPPIPYLNEGPSTQPAEVPAPPQAAANSTLETDGIPPSTSRVAIEGATLASSDIEILWEVPEDSVDGFVVRYGTSREELGSEVKLTARELELFADPQRGQIYRHVLKNVPADRTVFVNIAAYRGAEVSPPSRLFEVPAAQ